MVKKYNVAIIGAGSAGLSAAAEVKKNTDDFIVINDGLYGTTCARVGCMPSKVMIHAANDFHRREIFSQVGIHGGEALSVNRPEVMTHVRGLRDRFVRGVMSGISGDASKNLSGRATFIDAHTLLVGEQKIEAEKIIIATGTTPHVPEDWRSFGERVVTSDQFFELPNLPNRVAVAGLGIIGLELGLAMARLGVEVIGLNRSRRVAGISDPVVNEEAMELFSKEMPLWFGADYDVVDKKTHLEIVEGSKTADVDMILCALGRTPNLAGLGLGNLSLPLEPNGRPRFDRHTMLVEGTDHLFLVGDINGEKEILHEASDEGRIAGYNAVHKKVRGFHRRAPMAICFSDPQICFVGQRYSEIEHITPAIGEVSFHGQGRSLSMLKAKGVLRVYGCPSTGLLWGAEMIAPSGEHLAHLLAWAIQQKMTVFDVLQMPFYHPVVEEGLRTALRKLASQVDVAEQPFDLAFMS